MRDDDNKLNELFDSASVLLNSMLKHWRIENAFYIKKIREQRDLIDKLKKEISSLKKEGD